MKHPRKAVVLAAGYGARLLPLTLCRPKPLCPIWGKPVLVHALELLRGWGVSDVLLNVHCHAGKIIDYLRLHPVDGLRCQISFEPEILGTGGVLTRAQWFLDSAPFWMMNADVLADLPCAPILKAFEAHSALAALWLIPDSGPRTVETTEGLITNFRSAHPGAAGTATFSGLHLLSPRVLTFLPPTGENSIVDAYERAMRTGERIAGVSIRRAYWADIGTPASYLQAHRDVRTRALARKPGQRRYAGPALKADSAPDRFLCVGHGVTIASSARITNSVVWDDVTLQPYASVSNAVLADKVSVRGPVSYLALRADTLDDPELHALLRRLGWSPGSTAVLPLPPRGSARTFTRIQSGRRSAILIRYLLDRPENGLYSTHARFLAALGVRVPAVLFDDPVAKVTVLEDAGDRSLQDVVPTASRPHCLRLYHAVLDQLVLQHERALAAARRVRLPLNIPFDRSLYEWEQNLFCDRFLVPYVRPDADALRAVRRELADLIPVLLRAPRVLLHRDLQSSNVLLMKGQPVLIDFQGMRLGPAAYDLASLLCDPYVTLSPCLREALLDYYVQHTTRGETTRRLFWVAAVERLCQALGAYGRLGALPGTAGFLRHIPAGLAQLRVALDAVGKLPTLNHLLAAWHDTRGDSIATGAK
jgi:NDP-sugar pyrophosphorylase family protein/aminoglycoside/choline kinase family phosphotransferase